MIKGVNKNVIEIADTGNKYFERAILFVKPEYSQKRTDTLKNHAKTYISDIGAPKNTRRMLGASYKIRRKQSRMIKALCVLSFVALALFIFLLIK